MNCNPRGFYTVGKGKERVVHPVCGRGGSMAHIASRVSAANRYAKKHQLKVGSPIMVPKLVTFIPRAREATVRVRTPTLKRVKLSPVERKTRQRKARIERMTKPKNESGLNMRVTGVLARRFPGRLSLILEQANAAYHYRNPGLEANPEPYELSEGGFIDEALDSLGLPHVATLGS